MFKPHYGDCSDPDCSRKGVLIPVKSGLCQYCNHEQKQRNKNRAGTGTRRADVNSSTRTWPEEGSELFIEEAEPGTVQPRKPFGIRSSLSKKKAKPVFKQKAGTGQAEVFEEIAEEREWVCFVSDVGLTQLTATQFAHVLPKALNKYPLFKLYKKNIVILSDEIHYAWDFWPESKLRADRRFDKLFALQDELKEEYKLLKQQQ